MRDRVWAWLPALVAGLMMVEGSAAAMPLQAALCGGGSGEMPGKVPGGDCATACHAGCGRRKGQA